MKPSQHPSWHTQQCRPATWREGRNGSPCLEEQLTTTTDQELNFSLLFLSWFLLPEDAASQQVFFEMVLLLLVFSSFWLTYEIFSVVLCMFYHTDEFVPMFCRVCVCLWCFLFSFVCACVWVCEVECLSTIRSWIFFFSPLLRWLNCFPLII